MDNERGLAVSHTRTGLQLQWSPVFAGALVTGPLTGGSFNPARSLGPALAGGGWVVHWIYWLAPTLGMMVAMRVYEALRPASSPAVVPVGVPIGVEGPINARTRAAL